MNINNQSPTPSARCINMPAETKIPTGVPIATHHDMVDIGTLCASELHLLKKNDPFMYYSIPEARNSCLTDMDDLLPSLVIDSSGPTLTSGSEKAQTLHRPRNRRRSTSDFHLVVKRRSRISYESDMLESIIGDMSELEARHAKRRRSSSCSEIIEQSRYQQSTFEFNEPRRRSFLQDILFSMFESMCDEESTE